MFHEKGYVEALAEKIQTEHRLAMKLPGRKRRVPRPRPRTAIIGLAATELAWRRAVLNHALRMWGRPLV